MQLDQAAPAAIAGPAPNFQVMPAMPGAPPAAVPPTPATQATPQPGVITQSATTSSSPTGFPDPANLQNVEALLDIGESAAALVERTLPQTPMG